MGIVRDVCVDELLEAMFPRLQGVDGGDFADLMNAVLVVIAREILRERMDAAAAAEVLLEEQKRTLLPIRESASLN